MTKHILMIRENAPGGINNYCHMVQKLISDTDSQFVVDPITNIPTRRSRLFHYSYRWRQLYRAMKVADIIHINGYTAMGTVQAFLLAMTMRKRIVYTAHWHPFSQLSHPHAGRLFFTIFLRRLIAHAHTVITINNEDTAFFRRFCKRVVQIPHVVSVSDSQETKSKDPKMILFVGRVNDTVKGIEHINYLPVDKYHIHVVGNGTPPSRSDITHHIGISDSELDLLYHKASLLIVPSKYEAFSFAALEALLHATPILISERVRIADYLGGIAGVNTFRYGDYDEFRQAVANTIGTPVDVTSVARIFSPDAIAKRYADVYKQAL